MGKILFGTMDGEMLGTLDTISEVELTSEDNTEDFSHLKASEEFSCECQIEDMEKFEKHVVYGSDRGRYNGHVLARDGYLNEKNGWIRGK